jgi:hypothetical protein
MSRRDTILSQEIIIAQINHHVSDAWVKSPASASGCLPSYYDVLSILLSFFESYCPDGTSTINEHDVSRIHMLIQHTSSPIWVGQLKRDAYRRCQQEECQRDGHLRCQRDGHLRCQRDGHLRWSRVKIAPLHICRTHPLLVCIRAWPIHGNLHPVSWVADPFSEPAQVYANPLDVLKCCMDLARHIMRHIMTEQHNYHPGAQYLLDAAQLRILVDCTQPQDNNERPHAPRYLPKCCKNPPTIGGVAVVNLPCFHLSSSLEQHVNCAICGMKTVGPSLHILPSASLRDKSRL